ncbi:hypothetical protein F5Y08DRAFT_132589 [Xylaria arbuscula]|nr:hypothetical protein F5Y08DRAFT_132589 [Xylaria arbuscula]
MMAVDECDKNGRTDDDDDDDDRGVDDTRGRGRNNFGLENDCDSTTDDAATSTSYSSYSDVFLSKFLSDIISTETQTIRGSTIIIEVPTATKAFSVTASEEQNTALPITSTASISFAAQTETSTSILSDHGKSSGDSSPGLGSVSGIVLGSVLGGGLAILILLAIVWLTMRKAIPRIASKTRRCNWRFWQWKIDTGRRKEDEKTTEYRKPELDAINTGVGYHLGAPHELYVTRIGYDEPAQLDAERSPAEAPGSFSYV